MRTGQGLGWVGWDAVWFGRLCGQQVMDVSLVDDEEELRALYSRSRASVSVSA